jgi:ATP-dependent RNA helicase DHX37/DHR1
MPKFIPRLRKQKALAREKAIASQPPPPSTADSNALILLPSDQAAKDEKKRTLREEVRAQNGKVSSKKQKRLDKYIDTKLKKDENLEYLRLLEKEKEKADAVRERSENRANTGKRKFNEFKSGDGPHVVSKGVEEDQRDGDSEDSFEAEHKDAFVAEQEVAIETIPVNLGSGLAKPLDVGDDGIPVIQMKIKRKKRRKLDPDNSVEEVDGEGDSEWDGFSDTGAPPNIANVDAEVRNEDSINDDGDSLSHSEDDTDASGSEDEDDEDSDANSSTSETSQDIDYKPRASGFKAWATQQLNKSIGHTPSYENGLDQLPSTTEMPMPKDPLVVPSVLKHTLEMPKSTRKAFAVQVKRTDEMQRARSELPIIQREQEIMEAIHNNPVVIVKGDTGSGKTTQIPQFLYEAGYGSPNSPTPGMIGITQPRRVAAVSMSTRVGDELGDHGGKVAYQIRFDGNVSSKTAIKFMTDGILLRELSEDLLLRKYSVIVIDEAHERSVNTDILIGLLSKIIPARLKKNEFNPSPTPLKLVIMSATLNIADFMNDKIFPPGNKPPIVEAEGRQHRVTIHFALRSRADYQDEVVEKVRRAHRKLPMGAILVFLTGQSEIRQVQSRLHQMLGGRPAQESHVKVLAPASELPLEVEDMEIEAFQKVQTHRDDFDDIEIVTHPEDEEEDDEFDVSDDEDEKSTSQRPISVLSSKEPYTSVHILPLYSQLPTKQQLKVFEPPPAGARLIVLATNVAETSLTIPGIRYVFDAGRSKERKYNLDSGVQSFEIDYISKASAAQRTGRAGRTGPGHCWRLYTSAVYEGFFPEHAAPEILRAPAENVVLQLKSFAYPKPIIEFPFPSAPSSQTLKKAEMLLKNLGALNELGSITDLGKDLSVYPLSPRLGKIVFQGVREMSLLSHVICLVAGLAVSELFLNETQLDLASGEEEPQIQGAQNDLKQEYGRARAMLSRLDKSSDAMKLLTAVLMYIAASDKENFCKTYFLRPKAMFEVAQLHGQLTSLVRANHSTAHQHLSQITHKLSSKQTVQLNSIAASGYIDQVAIRADLAPNPPDFGLKPRRSIDVPYLPLIPLPSRSSKHLQDRLIFIHPSSVLAKLAPKSLPEYLVYTHLQKSQPKRIDQIGGGAVKTRMFPLTPVSSQVLLQLSRDTALLHLGKPLANSKIEDVKGTPKRRECWVSAELRGSSGGLGWPLPPVKVREVLDVKTKSGWRVEEWLN